MSNRSNKDRLQQLQKVQLNRMSVQCNSSSLVSFGELRKLGNKPSKDVYIIDVREPTELQETGVIPSSINIPLGELESALKDLNDGQFRDKFGRDKPGKQDLIIFSCLKGGRSTKAQEISQKLGYQKVSNFVGGWTEWAEKIKNKCP
ncbi:unnamed protein product [Callosobruchus maculatus]|uniref:Rhodanese domain-containing protein n=1 Tax=Callosobruchus maculatus TaxID=64391 RepID=A0A653BMK4_CALMS|nr:unnamed protein product [Callosobruchus maculatus]